MNEQVEIRKGVENIVQEYSGFEIPEWQLTEEIMTYLHSQGVVIKVDRELPPVGWFWKNCKQQRNKPAKICLECPFVDYKTGKIKAGYVAVEPLIKEE